MCRFTRSQRTRLDACAVISEIGEHQRLRNKSWLGPQKMCESIDPYGEAIFVPSFCIAYVTRLYCLCWRYSMCTQREQVTMHKDKGVCTVVVDFKLDILDQK
jgi:hypothetical protein